MKDYTNSQVFTLLENKIRKEKLAAKQKTIQYKCSSMTHLKKEILSILRNSKHFHISDTAEKLGISFDLVIGCLVQLQHNGVVYHDESGYHARGTL